ncbi:MAG: DUF4038 domain-containing protein [Proteobacteria bacterium]|nr:DUF4038 domain-containing protein [Pseudomonadota bacterium]
MFPLALVGGRYLQDAQGNPFLLQGDAAWSLIAQLSDSDVDVYIADRKAKGFNALLVNLIEHVFANNAPADIAGDQPFTTTGDFSTPNDTYFNHAVSVVTKAQAAGMAVLLVPAYMGYGCPTSLGATNQGWYAEMNGSGGGTTKLQGYGAYVATKMKAAGLNNIIWVNGGDCDPTNKGLLDAIAAGINGVTPNALFTFHGERNNNIASGELGSGHSWLNINTIYTDDQFVIDCAHAAYSVSPVMPFFLVEAIYENEAGGFTAAGVRQQAWQAVLGGAMGQVMGNNPVWCYGETNPNDGGLCLSSTWKTHLADAAAGTMPYIASILGSSWTQLAPDATGAYLSGVSAFGACSITGSGGKGSNPVAAFTADSSRVVVYTPTNNSNFTIKLSAMAGAGGHVAASWYDPTNGSSQAASGSPYAASGTHAFTTPGNNHLGDGDWVLVLTAQP